MRLQQVVEMFSNTSPIMFALLALALCVRSQPLEVIKLTQDSFEHQTQASTGQTTGQWCVLFLNSTSSNSQELVAENAWEQLAEVEDKAAIMAKVDVATAAGVAKRFSIRSTPSVILFRDRAMYPLNISSSDLTDAHKLAAAVEAFVSGGYEQQEAKAVPAEPSPLSLLIELASFLEVQPNWYFYAGVTCLSVGVLLFVGFFAVGTWYCLPDRPAKKQPAAEVTQETSTKAPAAASEPTEAAAAAEGSDTAEGGDAKPATTRVTRRRA